MARRLGMESKARRKRLEKKSQNLPALPGGCRTDGVSSPQVQGFAVPNRSEVPSSQVQGFAVPNRSEVPSSVPVSWRIREGAEPARRKGAGN